MNTFVWLVVGHLVGDWMLQNDWMAKNKTHDWVNIPGMVHFVVYTVVLLIAFWIAGFRNLSPTTYLLVTVYLFVTHWIVDAGNLARTWGRFYRQTDTPMVRVMVDQTFHMLLLAALAAAFPR